MNSRGEITNENPYKNAIKKFKNTEEFTVNIYEDEKFTMVTSLTKTINKIIDDIEKHGTNIQKSKLNKLFKKIENEEPEFEDLQNFLKYLKEIKNYHNEFTNLESNYNDFIMTSKETDFQKYNTKDLELMKLTKNVKTKDTEIDHHITYNTSSNGKKIVKKKDGVIITSFQSPLDWLDKTYDLNLSNIMTDQEVIQKIQATKFFEIKSEQETLYNSTCALLRSKSIKENKDTGIFISFNELHKQMGYKGDLRKTDIDKYKNLIESLSYLHVNISMDKAVYANHKEYYKINGNIENEPLIIYTGFCKAKAKINKTSKIVNGFKTNLTELMKLHFNYTKQYSILPKTIQEQEKTIRKSKLEHATKLDIYIKKLFFINTGNKNYCVDISYNTFFKELKEFNLDDEYKKTIEKSKFIKRKFLNPINKSDVIKKAEILNNKIRIYFNEM